MKNEKRTTKRQPKSVAGRKVDPNSDPLGWAKFICQYPAIEDDDEMSGVRNAAIALIVNIINVCEPSPDRLVAIRKVREALMTAHAAAVLRWES